VSFERHRCCGSPLATFAAGIFAFVIMPSVVHAQQLVNGFAIERFYPPAPGGGWFVIDDLNLSGGVGGAIEVTSGYARNPLKLTGPDGTQRLALVTNEAFVDLGAAATYDRYRIYLNLPLPYVVTGNSGTLGLYQLNAPAVSAGTNPDTVADSRIGFDVRLFGQPRSSLRLGTGAQLILPSGDRADYVSDARYRGMFRFLAAGDAGGFSYAGQVGIHLRPLNDAPAPGSPSGHEFLFGGGAGRRFSIRSDWAIIVGPEIFGETTFNSFFDAQRTAVEGLLTGRLEREHFRIKAGLGHGLVQHFGAPQWRILVGVDLFGQRARNQN
jgi:hypothetical protein